ncbi:MAG: oxalate:formate antiporter [Turicibacter sp.]|nr:oxalate:formate antiporter [Turicibacter sp.]
MYTLDSLNRLSEIQCDQDIKSLSHAIFPGTHCPLFGVALTASYVQNMTVVVIGTSECTYYTKNFAYHRQKGRDSVYSLVLEDKEVVFGAANQVEKAVKEIIKIENPDAIMLVTTCVPELIGEDYSGIQYTLEDEVNIPIFVVQTEHFKCNSHIPGMSRTLKSFAQAMKPCVQNESVNILGHRQDKVDETELVKLLTKHNIMINTVIPSKCTIEEIKEAPKAKLNIVTDMIALDLAKEMKRRFNIDYIYFDKHLNHEIIHQNYEQIEQIFNISIQAELEDARLEYHQLFKKCQTLLAGKKLIYGNTPMMAFETVDFLSDLGLIPVFVQLRELYDQDIKFKDNLLNKGYNPYISRIANIAPLRELYDTIGADIYVGHESPMLLREKGMMQITFDSHAQKIGYELPIGMMKDMMKLLEAKSKPMGGMMHAAM